MSGWTFTRWRWRHPRLARLVPNRVAGWLVWREAVADPAFVDAMRQGLADIEAGRVRPWSAVKRVLDTGIERAHDARGDS